MSTKALKSQLLAAVAMVLVSSIALGSSTFAWFAINNKVTVTGMEVTTQVSSNLFIAQSTLDKTSVEDDGDFQTAMDVSILNGVLEPVSTINGVNYFYNSTKNVNGSGDAIADTYTAYNAGDLSAFNTNYGTTGAVGYVDYVFQLKAINTGNATSYVNMTGLNLVYGGSEATEKAFRAAVFVWDMGEDGGTAAGSNVAADKLKTILAPGGAVNFTDGEAVSEVGALASVVNPGAAANIGNVEAGHTRYWKVVVRLWLEGEDTTCTNTTFAALKDKWAMNLVVELAGATGGTTAINRTATDPKVDLSGAPSSGSDVAFTIDGDSYYEITGNSGYYLKTASTAVSSSSVIYQIVDGHPIDVTNQCKLPAPVGP